MAYSENLQQRTYIAGSTLVQWVGNPGMPGSTEPNIGTQYLFAKLDTANADVAEKADDGTVAGGAIIVGVTTTKSQYAKTPVAVAYRGRVQVQAGAALTYGQPVTTDANGKAVVGTPGTDQILGTVVVPASAEGVLATIDLELGK